MYIAINGNVYDFSKVKAWAGGKHNGYVAGKDLTDEYKSEMVAALRATMKS